MKKGTARYLLWGGFIALVFGARSVGPALPLAAPERSNVSQIDRLALDKIRAIYQ